MLMAWSIYPGKMIPWDSTSIFHQATDTGLCPAYRANGVKAAPDGTKAPHPIFFAVAFWDRVQQHPPGPCRLQPQHFPGKPRHRAPAALPSVPPIQRDSGQGCTLPTPRDRLQAPRSRRGGQQVPLWACSPSQALAFQEYSGSKMLIQHMQDLQSKLRKTAKKTQV